MVYEKLNIWIGENKIMTWMAFGGKSTDYAACLKNVVNYPVT
jgi:hypothetical protein